METATYLMLIAAIAPLVCPAKLPPYLKACKRSDPKLNECEVKNWIDAFPKIVQGDPKLGIPKLDPLIINKLVVGDSKSSNGLGLAFTCEKCNIIGVKDLQLKSFKIDPKAKKMDIEARVPRLEIKGHYTTKGKVLVLPISGDGQADLVLRDLNLVFRLDYDVKKGKDGKDYAKALKTKLDFKANGFHIQLTNLFKGDKVLGEQMNTFLNENWRDMLKEFGPAVNASISKIIMLFINNITEKVPYDEILPPK